MTRSDHNLHIYATLIDYNDAVFGEDIAAAGTARDDLRALGYATGHDIGAGWYAYASNGSSIVASRRGRVDVYRTPMQARIYRDSDTDDAIAFFTDSRPDSRIDARHAVVYHGTNDRTEDDMSDETYNGWEGKGSKESAYATWRVALELVDFGYWSEEIDERTCVFTLADRIKDECTEIVCGDDHTAERLVTQYALSFLDDVNWYEIAEHILSD